MLNYSAQAFDIRPTFFASLCDITIIVEDFGKEQFYSEVINRLLQGEKTVIRVLGMGGKTQVLARFAEREKSQDSWRELYLVDGDFDELLGLDITDSTHIFRLDRYDIESYLVEELAVCTIAAEERPRQTTVQFQSTLQIQTWIEEVVDISSRLAACAALLQELGEEQTGISTNIERYVSRHHHLPDKSTIDCYIAQVRASVTALDPQEFDACLQQMMDRMGSSTQERLRWISGKDVLLPLLIRLLRRHTSRNIPKESLCFRLAKNCNFPELEELRARILAAA